MDTSIFAFKLKKGRDGTKGSKEWLHIYLYNSVYLI